MDLKFWKNIYFKLGVILGIFLISLLIVLPRTPVLIQNEYVDIDTTIGGYYLTLADGSRLLDLRDFRKGLDINGGVRIVLRTDMSGISPEEHGSVLETARQIIERRVRFLGITDSNITTSKAGNFYRITVELPRTAKLAEAVDIVGKTSKLQFTKLKDELEWDESKRRDYFLDRGVWEDVDLTGADIKSAEVVFPQGQDTKPGVQIFFTNEGKKKFEELAKSNIGRPVALFSSDSEVPIFMPVVSEEFAEGLDVDPTISGDFDIETATSLSVQIKAGALPVDVEVIEQTTVEPTLGSDNVRKGLQAGMIGVSLVFLYMLLIYGKLGLIADISLLVYGMVFLAVMKAIPVTMTIPGIAGFFLALGLAIDSNILIFERIKEEIKWDRPKSLALRFGFGRAWTSIRDANILALLIGVILLYFGNNAIKGFAVTLMLGILISLVISNLITRTLIEVLGVNKDTRADKIKKLFSRKKDANIKA